MNKPELPPSVPGSGEEAPASPARHRLLAAVVARFNLWRSRVDRKLDQWEEPGLCARVFSSLYRCLRARDDARAAAMA